MILWKVALRACIKTHSTLYLLLVNPSIRQDHHTVHQYILFEYLFQRLHTITHIYRTESVSSPSVPPFLFVSAAELVTGRCLWFTTNDQTYLVYEGDSTGGIHYIP